MLALGLRIYNPSLVFNRIEIMFSYIFNNGGNSRPYRWDFSFNMDYIREFIGLKKPKQVYLQVLKRSGFICEPFAGTMAIIA